ncbi:hypothetical protein D3Z62_25840 [Lachnospiraceae bacterium]|nr:hypothetical protein [Lachnospiraceae bacterium]
MKVNFFDKGSVIKAFSELYGMNDGELIPLSYKANLEDDPIHYFLEHYPIQLDMIDISDIELHCKHITTSFDRMESFKKYGFLTLNKTLSQETPLKKFLSDRGISFDLDERKIIYNGKIIHLIEGDQECKECFYGKECQYLKSIFSEEEPLGYRDFACPYRDSIKIIRSKLFHDKGEIEVHLSGSFKDVHDYSEVKYNPEFLVTLENMINKLFDDKVRLVRDWRNLTGGKYYCLEFDVNIEDFEYITSSPQNDWFWYNQFFDLCVNNYYSLEEVNKNFYGNLYLLGVGIRIICDDIPVKYGKIKNGVEIPIQNMDIVEHNIK